MVLNVFERLLLRNIMPQIQGWNYAHLKEARELVEGLFTEQEEADLCFQQLDTKVQWKLIREDGTPIPQERDIPISNGLTAKIYKFLTQLDEHEQLSYEQMSLYEKFVPKVDARPTDSGG
jgi:hypothetical protein